MTNSPMFVKKKDCSHVLMMNVLYLNITFLISNTLYTLDSHYYFGFF